MLGQFGDWIFGGYLNICKNRSDWDIWDIHIFARIVWTGVFGIFGYLQEWVGLRYLGCLDIFKNGSDWDIRAIWIFSRIGWAGIFGFFQE